MDLLARPAASTVRRVKSYGQFCPVAKACEIVAERWTPLVLGELLSLFAGVERPSLRGIRPTGAAR